MVFFPHFSILGANFIFILNIDHFTYIFRGEKKNRMDLIVCKTLSSQFTLCNRPFLLIHTPIYATVPINQIYIAHTYMQNVYTYVRIRYGSFTPSPPPCSRSRSRQHKIVVWLLFTLKFYRPNIFKYKLSTIL